MSDVDSGNLDKRSKPIPFDEHVRLGARLVECLKMNDATARLELQIAKKLGLDEDLQSCYKEYNDLAKHDWEAHRRNGRKIVYDRAFWASERWLEDALATLSPHGAMLGNYEMRYDHPCGKLNPLEDGAKYHMLANPSAGIIVALAATCPESHLKDKLDPDLLIKAPLLARWSDVAFLAYQEQCRLTDQPVANLRYILQSKVVNKRTYQAIREILQRSNPLQPSTAEMWCLEFSVDKPEAKALIATPNGYGIAWLLLRHRRQLGWKGITKVTVLVNASHQKSEEPNAEGPHLLFEVADI